MFQKPLAHKLFRKLVVSMRGVKQTLPAQEVVTPTCLDKKSPGHRDPMLPEEEEAGGKMGTCLQPKGMPLVGIRQTMRLTQS